MLPQALTAEIANQHKALQSQTAQLATYDKQLAESQQRITQMEQSAATASTELRASRDRVAQLEEANRKLGEEVEAGVQLSVDVVNLKQELEAAHRELEAQRLANRTKLNKFGLQVLSCNYYAAETYIQTQSMNGNAIAFVQLLTCRLGKQHGKDMVWLAG